MGRHDVKRTLPQWDDCQRCERASTRLGVLAPAWPSGVRVVVMGLAAGRAEQGVSTPSPALLGVGETIAGTLGLGPDQWAVDTLVACGLGRPFADHVAACSARFADQRAAPEAVVLCGDATAAAAHRAGLIDNGTWAPLGAARVPMVTGDLATIISVLSNLLQVPARPALSPSRANLTASAPKLHRAVAGHSGVGVLPPSRGKWGRAKTAELALSHVVDHLAGRVVVAPFRPRGPWPFVVIDVDRHNALQEERFSETCRLVRRLFPHAFELRSSDSGGRHFYVKLRPDTDYEQAALHVRAFLALQGARWIDEGKLRAERAEVPSHPVRLPFGVGSCIPGSSLPLEEQLEKFLSFVRRGRHADYNKAVACVGTHLKFRGAWSVEKRRKLERFLAAEEVRDLRAPDLAPTDPWLRILPKLSEPLQKIAATGAPAFGTRSRWTVALINALTQIVAPEQAQVLMSHWLEHRDHVSESLEVDPAHVHVETRRWLRDKYKRAGVPVRFWRQVQRELDAFFHARRTRSHFWPMYLERLKHPDEVPSRVRATAFAVVRKFYERGVSQRRIGWREFAEHVGKQHARDVERLLANETWLRLVGQYVPGDRSRRYQLAPTMWPPSANEPRLYSPP